MYLDHFGLKESPFGLTPNTQFLFQSKGYREALNVILFALSSGEGFVKIVGEVGCGKTFLCRKVLHQLTHPEYVTAYLPNPLLSSQELYRAFAGELGLSTDTRKGFQYLLREITHHLIQLVGQGRKVVLLVDEAQSLPDKTLEALRLMTNLETEQRKIVQVVLFGQPELDERLRHKKFRQLRQRITFSYTLPSLDREETHQYLAARLKIAGVPGHALISSRGVRLLHQYSGGIPRLINILAHKSLLAAFGKGNRSVLASHVKRAAQDTEGVVSRLNMNTLWLTLLGAAGLAGGAAWFYFQGVLP
ncbi:MAG: AAA family ATPase [Magnetococcales bacterium]|nr:AAA family ATPase [Magnetococcales bacterium]